MNKLVATGLESKLMLYDIRTHNMKKGFASLSEKVGVVMLLVTILMSPSTGPQG